MSSNASTYDFDFSNVTKKRPKPPPKHDVVADMLRLAGGVAPVAGTVLGAGLGGSIGALAAGIPTAGVGAPAGFAAGMMPGAAIGGAAGAGLGGAANYGADILDRDEEEAARRQAEEDEEQAAQHRAALQMLGGF